MNPFPEGSFPTIKRRDRPKSARFAMRLAYDGGAYSGFQRQPDRRTVEGEVVRALVDSGLTGGLSFASRTDAGVHAEGQVVAFRAPAVLTPESLENTLSARLPADVRIRALRPAPAKFHPRWSAVGKFYRYTLALTPEPQVRAWSVGALPVEALARSLAGLAHVPRLDGFTAAGAPDKPAEPLERLVVRQEGELVRVEIEGPAFRRYAIRHLVGAAVAHVRGEGRPPEQIALEPAPYRGLRAPADGLVLVEVRYPAALDPFGS